MASPVLARDIPVRRFEAERRAVTVRSMDKRAPYNAVNEDVPNRLRELRLAAGLSIDDMVEKTGLTWQTIQRKETGARKLYVHELPLFAGALGVAQAEILRDGGITAEERQFLELLRSLDERDRRTVRGMAEQMTEWEDRRR